MATIKQNTAYNRMVYLGATGLTPAWQISKNGGAFAAIHGTAAEVGNAWYVINLDATDTNTLGELAYYFTAGGGPSFSDLVTAAGADAISAADIAAIKAKTDHLPSVNAGAINGLHILGTNAGHVVYSSGMEYQGGTGVGLTISAADTDAVSITSSLGNAITLSAIGNGLDVTASGYGARIASGSDGVKITATSANAINLVTATSGVGINIAPASGSSGIAIAANSADAVTVATATSGTGVAITAAGIGMKINSTATDGMVILGHGGGGRGLLISSTNQEAVLIGGAIGVSIDGTDGKGLSITGTTHAIHAQASAGVGLNIAATGDGIHVASSAGKGSSISGATIGCEVVCSAGDGVTVTGNQKGVIVTSAADRCVSLICQAATKEAMYLETSGDGINIQMNAVGFVDFRSSAGLAGFPQNFSALSITAQGAVLVKGHFQRGVLAQILFPLYEAGTTKLALGARNNVLARVSTGGAALRISDNNIRDLGQGIYLLTLSADEMNSDIVLVVVTPQPGTTSAVASAVLTFYPN